MGKDDERRKVRIMDFLDKLFGKKSDSSKDTAPDTGSSCFVAEEIFDLNGFVSAEGEVIEGSFGTGDKVYIDNLSGKYREAYIEEIRIENQTAETVSENQEALFILRGINIDEIQQGDMIIR